MSQSQLELSPNNPKTLQSIINVTKEMDELINKLRSTLFGLTQVFCEANVATVPGLAFVAVFLD